MSHNRLLLYGGADSRMVPVDDEKWTIDFMVWLLQALEAHFAPFQYDDPTRILFKLTQRGSIMDYLSQFETLANRIVGLPTPFLLSCFISGLKPDILREVQALQPLTLIQAIALARLQEEKITHHHYAFHGHLTPGLLPPLGLPLYRHRQLLCRYRPRNPLLFL